MGGPGQRQIKHPCVQGGREGGKALHVQCQGSLLGALLGSVQHGSGEASWRAGCSTAAASQPCAPLAAAAMPQKRSTVSSESSNRIPLVTTMNGLWGGVAVGGAGKEACSWTRTARREGPHSIETQLRPQCLRG